MNTELRPVRVNTGSPDEQGRLVFVADRLVAVLVQLSEQHGSESGCWFLEYGFGRLSGSARPAFTKLDDAERWISEHFVER